MNMVSPHGKYCPTLEFLGLFESLVLCLDSGVVVCGKVCYLFPGVSSLKIGHVNEHGQPPWTKIV